MYAEGKTQLLYDGLDRQYIQGTGRNEETNKDLE